MISNLREIFSKFFRISWRSHFCTNNSFSNFYRV
jgi:hypothetical protein